MVPITRHEDAFSLHYRSKTWLGYDPISLVEFVLLYLSVLSMLDGDVFTRKLTLTTSASSHPENLLSRIALTFETFPLSG